MRIETDKIKSYCRSHPRLRELIHDVLLFDQVGSSNQLALEMAASGLPGGTVFIAESQKAGKGRLGRSWFSPPGRNIYLSLLLRPYLAPREYPLFSPATAVAIVIAIQRSLDLKAGIKWPNDILIGGKKIGGILLESKTTGDQNAPLVIGLGLNVNIETDVFPPELQGTASSLKIETGKNIDRTDLINVLLECLGDQIFNLQEGKKEDMLQLARRFSLTLGKFVQVKTAQHVIEGWAETIEEDGALTLRLGDQSHRSIVLGEITHLREATAP